jgi:hypothetical protein
MASIAYYGFFIGFLNGLERLTGKLNRLTVSKRNREEWINAD